MSEPKIGKLIDDVNAQRDAVHVAIIPLIAGEELRIGSKIKLKFGSTDIALDASYNAEDAIGIVDPFLDSEKAYYIEKGQRFYGFLFPGTVTGMRHHWQHPKFENIQVPQNEHEAWLRDFCDRWNFDYHELIRAAIGLDDPEWRYVVAQGRDLHTREELGEDYDLFWHHFEALAGEKFDDDHKKAMQWSCSC